MIKIDGKPVDYLLFSGGEVHTNLSNYPIKHTHYIYAELYSSEDIMCLMMVVSALKERSNRHSQKIELHIPYLPYARQDRVCSPHDANGLNVMAGIINSLGCCAVVLYNPHSQVAIDTINNVRVLSQEYLLINTPVSDLINFERLAVISPDAGAVYKSVSLAQKFATGVYFCKKQRDATTGKITKTVVPPSIKDVNGIVCDDICDGGRTFIELAKQYKLNGGGDLYLYVTHGIFSKGVDCLRDNFKHIYCTFSHIGDPDPSFLTVMGR